MGCCQSMEDGMEDTVHVHVRAGGNQIKPGLDMGKGGGSPPLTTRDIQIAQQRMKHREEPLVYTPQTALKALMEGNARFVNGITDHPHQGSERVHQIAQKQTPFAAVLGCADSRVPAEILFDQGLGDMFVCRLAGNIATSEQVASLEYAVAELNVKLILILGHQRCGAVHAALAGKPCPGFINTLLDNIDVPVERVRMRPGTAQLAPDARMDMVIRENVLYQMQRIQRSKVLLEAMQKNAVAVAGAYYDLDTGRVVLLDEMLNKMFCKTVGSGPAPPALANQARQVRSAPVVPDYDDDEEEEAPRARRR